ncbi:MAG: hypothetical protein KF858_16410 [Candidatus Sumerlaeia bacterium]|nr:hypothetical protein [Candidatus Sumerlaeia bacterium]
MTLPPWARLGAVAVAAAVFLVLASIHQPTTGWNVNTRLALVFAIVDDGTFAIDGYHETGALLETQDKALFEGRHYSDKVFGVSLLGLPVYGAMQLLAALFDFEWPFQAKNYLLRLVAVSIPAALSVALLWLLLVRIGAAPRRALFAVAAVFFGSMWFGYATIFMPYIPGIAACLGALYVLLYPPANRLTRANSFAIGLLCGFAMICDFIFGLIVLAIGVVYLMRLADQTGLRGMRCFADMTGPRTPVRGGAVFLALGALGGALPLALFFAYTYAIFGRPGIPYEYEALDLFRESMQRGFMGIEAPRAAPAWFLTLHPFRGVLFWSPWIVLALAGCVLGTRSAGRRRLWGWLGLWAFVAYLLFNAGYYMWWGGWAMGPRLMLPMMVAVPMGLAEICRRDRPRALWHALLAAGIVALLLNVPLALMDPQLPQGNEHDLLAAATLGTKLDIPQFAYLRVFWRGWWYVPPSGSAPWYHFLPPLAALAAAALLAWTARRLPEKHLPYERLEAPLVNFDGTAAPLPQARRGT